MFLNYAGSVKMNGMRGWLLAAAACLLLTSAGAARPHRRSMLSQSALPVSKSGWRPVIGSSSLFYGSFGTAPLHASPYKTQFPQFDLYPSSSRPVAARDANKLTSIAQAYKPTTLRTVPSPAAAAVNQPINSYHNPFTLQNQGLSHYKFVQNFPMENIVIRNPHNPYAARPVQQQKAPPKLYKPISNQILQQLSNQNYQNMQPLQLGHFPTLKPMNQINDLFNHQPLELFSKPLEKPLTADTEIYKPDVYKVPSDTDTAPQSVSPVQTAQQQSVASKPSTNPYSQYSYQNSLLPPSILGSFGLQSVVGRNPVYHQPLKTTFLPSQPTRQTIFNSFNFAPNFKSTPTFFPSSTPRFQTSGSQIQFGSTLNNYAPTEQTKVTTPAKIDPNAGAKTFKPSPQDPFSKNYPNFDFSISTYNPRLQSTTLSSNIFDSNFNFISQPKPQVVENVYKQPSHNNEKKKHKVPSLPQDSVAAGGNQQPSINSPPDTNNGGSSLNPHSNTYEVTENADSDVITHSAPQQWPAHSAQSQQDPTEESVTKQDYVDSVLSKPSTTPQAEIVEDIAIVTEGNKGLENSLSYDSQIESQSRRPLGDDFEPIEKHKLKDYYYRVSTPSYHDKKGRRTKKPSESSSNLPRQEGSSTSSAQSDALPTLPPNLHFKRPSSTPEPLDKDKIRKRNKIRRRRPPLANINRNRNENIVSSTEISVVTEGEVNHNKRVKPTKPVTSPPVTTEFTTSALPTVSPTLPTIVKKKLIHRRPASTTPIEKLETTTLAINNYESSKETSIMKIASRQQYPKLTPTIYEVRTTEIPDYTHKQDEKDTPTSDVAVNLSDSLKTASEQTKEFSFHRDAKPIDAKEAATSFIKTTTEASDFTNEITTVRNDPTSESTAKIQRPRLKNKYNRLRFSVKDYRNRLSSTTSTTEKSVDNSVPKVRFPHRRVPNGDNYFNSDVETTTERKKFMPKEPRYKTNKTEIVIDFEKEAPTTRQYRQRQTTTSDITEATTQKMSSRIRNGQRRPRPTEEPYETTSHSTTHSKRPLRKKIKDSDVGESVQDVSITESTTNFDKNDITSERTRSESAIMKIADKKHQDHHVEHLFEHSKRVSDLTLAASKDYNTPGMFKSVSTNSRRIPNYFTIATDDPILPIEAFFPQLNQKKES